VTRPPTPYKEGKPKQAVQTVGGSASEFHPRYGTAYGISFAANTRGSRNDPGNRPGQCERRTLRADSRIFFAANFSTETVCQKTDPSIRRTGAHLSAQGSGLYVERALRRTSPDPLSAFPFVFGAVTARALRKGLHGGHPIAAGCGDRSGPG
jgi:hypothetical protein